MAYSAATGQERAAPPAQSPIDATAGARSLSFYRLMVPEEELGRLAKGHVPVRRDELRRLIDDAARRWKQPFGATARLRRATYTAESRDESFHGVGEFDVLFQGDEPVWIPLPGSGLAFREMAWKDDRKPIALGVGPDGIARLRVDRQGTIRFEWTAATRSDGGLASSFDWRFPRVPRSRLTLKLSPSWRVTGAGFVQRNKAWQLDFAGGPVRFDVQALEPDGERTSRAMVGCKRLYRVTRAGLEWSSEFHWEAPSETPAEIRFRLPEGTELVGVDGGRAPVGWRVDRDESGGRRWLVMGWPPRTRHRRVRIDLLTPLPMRKLVALPVVDVPDAMLQQASIAVQLERGIELERLDANGCVEIPVDDPSASNGRRFDFVTGDWNGTIGLQVRPVPRRVRVRIGSRFLVTSRNMTAVFRIELEGSDAAAASVLPIRLAKPWRIESIDCEPAEYVEDYEPQGTDDEEASRILVWWRTPPRAGSRAALTIRARHAGTREIGASLFRALKIEGVPAETRWVSIEAAPGMSVRAANDRGVERLRREAPTEMTENALALLPGLVQDHRPYVFRDGPRADSLVVRVLPAVAPPVCRVVIESHWEPAVRAAPHGAGRLTETFHIRCEASAAGAAALDVVILPAGEEPIQWRLVAPSEGTFRATRDESTTEESADLTGVRWRFEWDRPMVEPVWIVGTRQRDVATPDTQASLLYIPQARVQDSVWTLRAPPHAVWVDHENVHELAADGAGDVDPPVVARFRYDTTGDGRISLRPAKGPRPPLCWIDTLRCATTVDASGTARHLIRATVVNHGATEIRWKWPSDARPVSWRVVGGGEPRGVRNGTADVALPIPPDERAFEFSLEVTTRSDPPRVAGTVAVWRPIFAVPVHRFRGELHLPAGWEAAEPSRTIGWRVRLFGPWLVPNHEWKSNRASGKWEPRGDVWFTHVPHAVLVVWPIRTMVTGWVVAWLVTLALALRLGRHRPRWLPLAVSFVLWLAWLLPMAWAWLGSSLVWGALLGGAVTMLRVVMTSLPPRFPSRAANASSMLRIPSTVTQIRPPLWIFAAIGVAGISSLAAARAPSEKIIAIIVPVDAAGVPTGTHDYVPKGLYDKLQRARRRPLGLESDWLVERAEHQVSLDWTAEGTSWNVVSSTSRLSLETFRPGTDVSIPFGPIEVETGILEVRLDGAVLPPEAVRVTRDRVEFTVADTGVHPVEIRAIRGRILAWNESFVQVVPPVPQATVTVRFPSGGPIPLIHPAEGGGAARADRGELRMALGPTWNYSIALPERSGPSRHRTAPRASELVAVRLRMHSVVVDYQLAMAEPAEAWPEITADESLELLAVRTEGVRAEPWGERDGHRRWRLRIDRDRSPPRLVRLRFLWVGRKGVGQWRAPWIEADSADVARRVVLFDVAPDLIATWPERPSVPKETLRAFLLEEPSEGSVQRIYELDKRESGDRLTVATRAPPLEGRIVPHWHLTAGWRGIEWHAALRGEVQRGTLQHLEVELLPGMTVTGAAIRDGMGRRPVRYVNSPGRVTLLWDHPVRGSFEWILSGNWRIESDGRSQRIALPRLVVEAFAVEPDRYHIDRRDTVLLSTDGLVRIDDGVREETRTAAGDRPDPMGTRTRPVGPDDGTPAPGNRSAAAARHVGTFSRGDSMDEIQVQHRGTAARHVGTFSIRPDVPHGSIEIRRNRPRLQGNLLIVPQRDAGEWRTILEYEGRVANAGAARVEHLRFVVPREWSEVVRLPAGWHARWEEAAEETQRHLVLVPAAPPDASVSLQIVLRRPDATEPMLVPMVRGLDHVRFAAYLALPRQLGNVPLRWHAQGVRAGRLPPELATRLGSPVERSWLVFRVAFLAQPTVTLYAEPHVARERAPPQVSWEVDVTSGEAAWARVEFQVVAPHDNPLQIVLDSATELISAEVDGSPARVERRNDGGWRVDLGASLAQRTLVLECRIRRPENARRSDIPRSLPLPTIALPTIDGFEAGRVEGTVVARSGQHVVVNGRAISFHVSQVSPQTAVRRSIDSREWPARIALQTPAATPSHFRIGTWALVLLGAVAWGVSRSHRIAAWFVWPSNWLFLAGFAAWCVGLVPLLSIVLIGLAILVSIIPLAVRFFSSRPAWTGPGRAFRRQLDSTWYAGGSGAASGGSAGPGAVDHPDGNREA